VDPAVGWTLSRLLGRRQQDITLGAAAAVLVLTAVLPLLTLLVEALSGGASSVALLASARTWSLLFRSLVLSAGVTLVAASIGFPLGLVIARTDVTGRRTLWFLHGFALFLPPFLIALGWFQWFGREGFIGNESSAAILFSEVGFMAVLGVTFSPVVTSLVALGVLGVDASLEEAARTTASPARVLSRILLPAAWPAVALALLVVFSLALSELGVATFLRVDVYAAAVFARLAGIDYAPGEAFTLVLPLVPIALALLWLERRFSARRSFAVLGLRASREPMPLGRWKIPLTAMAWLITAVSIAPMLGLVLRFWRSGEGLRPVLESAGRAPWNSLALAALAASVIVGMAVGVAHAAARGLRLALALDAVAVLSFVTPVSVLGAGLIAVWNRPATNFVYATMAILVVGCVARYAVIGMRVLASTFAQVPEHLEEAAAAAGARYWRRLFGIALPLGRRGVVFAWLLAAVFCLRDLETAVLFYPPGREPLTVRIFTLEANGPEALVAGLALLQIGLTALCAVVGGALLYRWKRP
jgi:iron(III) transport system permease protein